MQKRYMQIGEVAERTRLTQRTLRFYEEKGLLASPTRMEGGFRLYSDEDVQRIEHILQLKHLLGFSLSEIKAMVDAESEIAELHARYHQESDAAAKLQRIRDGIQLIERQEAVIDQKISQLQEMRARWQEQLERYRKRSATVMRELEALTTIRP